MNWDKGCYECYEYEIISETETYYLCRCIRCGNFFNVGYYGGSPYKGFKTEIYH